MVVPGAAAPVLAERRREEEERADPDAPEQTERRLAGVAAHDERQPEHEEHEARGGVAPPLRELDLEVPEPGRSRELLLDLAGREVGDGLHGCALHVLGAHVGRHEEPFGPERARARGAVGPDDDADSAREAPARGLRAVGALLPARVGGDDRDRLALGDALVARLVELAVLRRVVPRHEDAVPAIGDGRRDEHVPAELRCLAPLLREAREDELPVRPRRRSQERRREEDRRDDPDGRHARGEERDELVLPL